MSKEKLESEHYQRKRRKRVQFFRSSIIAVIVIWIILTAALMSMLCIKVVSLQEQLNEMIDLYNSIELTITSQEEELLEEEAEEVEEEDLTTLASQSLGAENNQAEEGDALKVYLTFDDGPSDNTDAILDVLASYDVKATFFVNGRDDEDSIAAYQRIVEEGHTLGMHSYSHSYSEVYASLESFASDFARIQELLYESTGVMCTYYRFPGGSSNRVSNVSMLDLIEYLDEAGITYFDWNVASGDATTSAYTADDLVENVLEGVVKYKTSVVLLHDASNKDATVAALPDIIEGLLELDAVILPIDDATTLIQHTSVQ